MSSPTPEAIAKFRRHGDSLKAQNAKLRHLIHVNPPTGIKDVTAVLLALTHHLDTSLEILDAALMCISHEAGGTPTRNASGDDS